MPLYRKKPVIIEAKEYPRNNELQSKFVAEWCGGKQTKLGCEITTLEGVMLANDGDMIIKGVSGEFYPCKPDIFAKTYEKAGGK